MDSDSKAEAVLAYKRSATGSQQVYRLSSPIRKRSSDSVGISMTNPDTTLDRLNAFTAAPSLRVLGLVRNRVAVYWGTAGIVSAYPVADVEAALDADDAYGALIALVADADFDADDLTDLGVDFDDTDAVRGALRVALDAKDGAE